MTEPERRVPAGFLAVLIATVCGVGFLRPAPGTWASLLAAGAGWLLLLALDGAFWPFAAAIAVVSAVGVWAAERYERVTGAHDAGPVVIDEVAGQWVTLAAVPALGASVSLQTAAAAFVLFRLFDVWKPGPLGRVDREVPGGLGTMADDWLAGLLAALVLAALIHWGGIA